MKFRAVSAGVFASLAVGLGLLHQFGCSPGSLDPTAYEQSVTRQDEAGSTHVAVLTAARFDDYKDALQPSFKMTSDDALAQAIPSTELEEERILDAVKAALKIALPSTSVTQTETTTEKTGAADARTLERVAKTEPGDLSKVTFGDSPAKDQDTSKLAPKDSVVTGTPSLDPMLKHLVATALYQEVQMLNRYVTDAARGDEDKFDAHVVRLQVTVLPRTRNLPYDVYTTISLFNGDFPCGSMAVTPPKALIKPEVQAAVDNVWKRAISNDPVKVDDQVLDAVVKNPEADAAAAISEHFVQKKVLKDAQRVTFQSELSAELACRLHDGAESSPQIVPLLVTDSIEAALHSRSVDQIRQLLLALTATVQGIGVGGDFQSVDQKIRNVLGRDFNSTFTVGRVSDNTIRVRFGAVQNPNMAYAMIPQTHNVTLLVLVPKTPATSTVRFISRTEFVHARSGQTPKLRTNETVREMARSILREYNVRGEAKDCQLDDLAQQALGFVDRNDYVGFEKFVNLKAPAIQAIESLWLDVVNLKTGGRYASGRILLQKTQTPSIAAAQNPVILDDGEKASIVTLLGVRNLRSTASLIPTIGADGKEFPATSIALADGGSRLVMAFPSLKAMKIKTEPEDLRKSPLTFHLLGSGGDLFASKPAGYELTKPEAPKSIAAASASAKTIRSSQDGSGTVTVSLSAKNSPIVFKVEGADVRGVAATGAKPITVTTDVGKWTLSDPANVELKLANLDPATPVTVIASSPKDAEATPPSKVGFTVIPLPLPEKPK